MFDVPEILVGFDIESTGLDTNYDEAISYGFAEFRAGNLIRTEQFFVLPDVQIHPGAERVHGVSFEVLRKLHREGGALSARAGASRATQRLMDYASAGASFVGANPMFDYSMLNSTLRRQGVGDLETFGLRLDELLIIDVVAHDKAIDDDRVARPRRGLANLCEFYDVTSGAHDAAEDARAAGEVLIAQIRRVNRQWTESQMPVSDVEVSHPSAVASSWFKRAIFGSR